MWQASRTPPERTSFAEFIDRIPLGLVVWQFDDLDDPATMRMVAINGAAARIGKVSPDKTLGRLFVEVTPNILQSGLPQAYAQVARTGQPRIIDNLLYGDDRTEPAYFRVHVFPLARSQVGIAFEDVTARKHAEDTLIRIVEALAPVSGEDFFRALVQRLAQACDADTALIGWHGATDGSRMETLAVAHQGRLIDKLSFDPADTPCGQAAAGAVVHCESGVQARFPRDGLLRTFGAESYLAIPLASNKGRVVGLIALMSSRPWPHPEQATILLRVVAARAVAELDRQRSEEALRESETFLRMSQRAGNVGSWQWDLRTNAVQWSDSMFVLYGIAPSDFDGTLDSATRTTHPDDLAIMTHAIQQTLRDGTGIGFEYRVLRDTGGISHLWSQSYVVADAAGKPTHVIGTVLDMTARKAAEDERKKLEAQIQQTQKLESLGVLAGGIAHDFNNILTGLLGYTHLAMQDLPPGSPTRGLVAEAVKAAHRAAELTQQMLAYSGRGQFVVGAIGLNSLVQDIAPLLQVSMSKKCSLSLELSGDEPTIDADAVQLRQIVMNLVINASEAMGDRTGVVRVETGIRQCDDRFLSAMLLGGSLPEGPYAYLQVADTGSGMSEETRSKIFDPFFTTKFTGRGLGLAAVLGIVRGHRGAIQVQSEPGQGTTFTIIFPLVGQARDTDMRQDSPPRVDWHGSGTALVIDDDEVIRGLAEVMLQRMGFTVLTACDGHEGVTVFQRHAAEVQLVLLDMTMPNLDGAETFAALRELRGDVRAILSSGYDEQSATRRFAGQGLAGFLQKPYTYDQLALACQQALRGTTPHPATA